MKIYRGYIVPTDDGHKWTVLFPDFPALAIYINNPFADKINEAISKKVLHEVKGLVTQGQNVPEPQEFEEPLEYQLVVDVEIDLIEVQQSFFGNQIAN